VPVETGVGDAAVVLESSSACASTVTLEEPDDDPKQKTKKQDLPPPEIEGDEVVAACDPPKRPLRVPKGKKIPRYPPEPWSPSREGIIQAASSALRPPFNAVIPGILAPFCTASCIRVTDAVLVRSVYRFRTLDAPSMLR
jgi:hypothetical protein